MLTKKKFAANQIEGLLKLFFCEVTMRIRTFGCFVLSFTLFGQGNLLASAELEERCRVVSLNEEVNPWEEGFVVFGEGDSDAGEVIFRSTGNKLNAIKIGQMVFSKKFGAKILVTLAEKETKYKISDENQDILIRVYSDSSRGIVLRKEAGESTYSQLAKIDCLNVDHVETADRELENVSLMNSQELRALPAEVQANFSKVDIAYELGDGYYSVKKVTVFKVMDRNTNVVLGYHHYAICSYTEGDDVEALVRFDRNGLRIGEVLSWRAGE